MVDVLLADPATRIAAWRRRGRGDLHQTRTRNAFPITRMALV
jgi:hypothetical protein